MSFLSLKESASLSFMMRESILLSQKWKLSINILLKAVMNSLLQLTSGEGNAMILFIQEIYRLPDLKLIVKAKVTGVATRKGRPVNPGDLISKLGLES